MIFNPSSGGGSWCDFTPGDFTRSRSAKRRPKPLLSKSFLPQAACDLFQTLDWKLGIWSKHVKTNPPKKVSLVTNPPKQLPSMRFPAGNHSGSVPTNPKTSMITLRYYGGEMPLAFHCRPSFSVLPRWHPQRPKTRSENCWKNRDLSNHIIFWGGQVLVGMGEWHPPAAGRLTNISLDSLGRGIIRQRPKKARKSNTSISKHM